ncbi:MAG: hypothetical protein M1838_003094 [Thelocarpon superellum]|nr:MAG: hypothetical protein M1838_003094 [Thelocarpon superellum]
MAKGLRSSVKKANKAKLRSRVFGPVENARTERLSAKLLELAAEPKAVKATDMTMDLEQKQPKNPGPFAAEDARLESDEMDVDEGPGAQKSKAKASKQRSPGRIQKRGRGKAKNAVVFPTYGKKGRGKGPGFTGSRR